VKVRLQERGAEARLIFSRSPTTAFLPTPPEEQTAVLAVAVELAAEGARVEPRGLRLPSCREVIMEKNQAA